MEKTQSRAASLRTKLTVCLILASLVMVSFSTFYVLEAWRDRQAAIRISGLSRGAEAFSYAFRDLTFERGRTNVALSKSQTISPANLGFILERRAAFDRNFCEGMAWLAEKNPEGVRLLQAHYQSLLFVRAKVDAAFQGTNAGIDFELREEWLSVSSDLAEQIIVLLDNLGKKQQISGRFSAYHQLIVDVLDFRNRAGRGATVMTAATSRHRPWQAEEYRLYLELQAQADYLWGKIRQTVEISDKDSLKKQLTIVEQLYYQTYRGEQAKLLVPSLTGEASLEQLRQLQLLSVEAFDSVFLLIDQIKQAIVEEMQLRQDAAYRKFIESLLHFYLSLAMIAFMLMYFNARLFQPLRAVARALENMRQGEPPPSLQNELRQTDEIGLLAAGTLLLQSTMEEERRLRGLHEYLAMIDELTGCLNRRSFYQRAELELARAIREERIIAFALLDLDNMKQVNDVYGHLTGDELLKHIVRVMSEHCRPYDLIGRFGGDEFMLLLQMHDEAAAKESCQRIFAALQEQPLVLPDLPEPLPVRISMGAIFGRIREEVPLSTYLELADKAMYAAKEQGKGRIVFGEMPN